MRVLSNHPRLFAMAMSAQACCPANGALIKTEPRVTPAGIATPTTARTGGLAVSLAMRGRIRIATQPTYGRIQRTITTLFPEMGVKAAYDHGSPNPARDCGATPPPRDHLAPDRPWAGSPQRTSGTLSTKRSDRADDHRRAQGRPVGRPAHRSRCRGRSPTLRRSTCTPTTEARAGTASRTGSTPVRPQYARSCTALSRRGLSLLRAAGGGERNQRPALPRWTAAANDAA
jgi:hypothetical protein